jgi:hypothetical protein
MGAYQGNYLTPGDPEALFDEELRYLFLLNQAAVPVVDEDRNDGMFALAAQLRRIVENSIGDGSPNDGFKIEESGSPSNNFLVKGGLGTADSAGRLFENGMPAVLYADVEYTDDPVDPRMKRIMPRSTALAATLLTDSAAAWVPNALIGRELTPDIDTPATTFTVTANTATTITVVGDMTIAASVGDHYRLELTTPSGGARVDEVYLDLFFDEVTDVEDPNLVHGALAPPQSAAWRLVLRQYVRVVEGGVTPADYVDADGRQHYTVKLATLNRLDTVADVLAAQIVDERSAISPAGVLLREIDGAPSLPTLLELRVPNGTLTDLGGGVAALANRTEHYLEAHNFDPVGGTVSGEQESPSFAGDFETYLLMIGGAASDRIDLQFQGRLAVNQTTIKEIQIPLKGTGDYQIKVFVEGQAGSNVYVPSALVAAPAGRTVVTIPDSDLSFQPNAEKRYHVVIEATLDVAEVLRVGRPFVVQE